MYIHRIVSRKFSTFHHLTPKAIQGGEAMYGAEFLNKKSFWFGRSDHHDTEEDDEVVEPTTDLSDQVVRALISRQPQEAALHIEEQLLYDQTNVLALRIAHDLHKRNGAVGNLAGSIPRVLPFWDGRHSGYRGLLGLHASSLTESLNWSSAEEAGMRALSDITMPRPGEGPSHDVVAVNALCDLLYLCGRSREGLRFLREISVERGPDRHDGESGLDAAIACARTVFYIDVGSRDLALHQLEMAMGDVPTLDLDGLTRLTSATWRAHCAYYTPAPIQTKTTTEDEDEDNQDYETEVENNRDNYMMENNGNEIMHPMWSRLWTQWRRHAAISSSSNEDTDTIVPLQFGPIHAAMATLVYGRIENKNENENEDEDADGNNSDQEIFNVWSLTNQENTNETEETEETEETKEANVIDPITAYNNQTRNLLCRGLLASARGNDNQAIEYLSPYEHTLRNFLGGEMIHHDSIVVGLPRHCMNHGLHVRARAMLSERSFLRPGSPFIWDEYSNALSMSGETMAAQMADDHASNLGFGQGGFGAH